MTVRELIIKLLEYEMDAQVQIARHGANGGDREEMTAWRRKMLS